MSYSFTVVANSKSEAKQKVAENFDTVVAAQPSHAADRDAAVTCAGAFIDLLAEPHEGNEISLSMHGSLNWRHDVPEEFLGSSIGVNAIIRNKAIS